VHQLRPIAGREFVSEFDCVIQLFQTEATFSASILRPRRGLVEAWYCSVLIRQTSKAFSGFRLTISDFESAEVSAIRGIVYDFQPFK